MGPRRTPHKERKPGNYEALGKIGRATGATLEDTGVRDEHGFEPVPNFSSPAKSLAQPNGTVHDVTNSVEDSMDIDQSTVPEPAELVRSTRNGRVSHPPKATSPIKTHLNSSPRRRSARSTAPLSSPSRNSNNGTPSRQPSQPLVQKPANRLLNFSTENIRESVEKSPTGIATADLNEANPLSASGQTKSRGNRKRIFNLTGREGDRDDSELEPSNAADMSTGIVNDEESLMPDSGDYTMAESVPNEETCVTDQAEEGIGAMEGEQITSMGPPATSSAQDTTKTRRNGTKSKTSNHDESQVSLPEHRPRGRPPKKTPVYQDPETNQPGPSSSASSGKRPQPPSVRDPNARSRIRKGNTGKPPSRTSSVAAGPRFVKRSETPANDSGALITRFGRQSIKPLASWRGEKTVMGDRTSDSLPGIKEVIRVDEIIEPRPKQRYRKGRQRVRPRLANVEEEEEMEDERADWELDPGIMVAQVMEWDATTNSYDEEITKDEDIAYSFEAIGMRDIQGADFKFAKTLTLDFFGSGMVHLPPRGAKRIKNSRKMQMVFFVFYGRVTVNIGTPSTTFSIGKGGQWQVPRGNFYAIANESDTKDARLFFAQGCEIQAGGMDESTMA